jgi:hypothetical protein
MKRVGSQIFVKLLSVKRYLKHIIAARVLFKNYLSAFPHSYYTSFGGDTYWRLLK